MVHLNIFAGIVSLQRMDPLEVLLFTPTEQITGVFNTQQVTGEKVLGLVNFLSFYMTFLNVIIFKKVQLHNTSSNKDQKYSTCIINQCTSLMVVAVILKFLV